MDSPAGHLGVRPRCPCGPGRVYITYSNSTNGNIPLRLKALDRNSGLPVWGGDGSVVSTTTVSYYLQKLGESLFVQGEYPQQRLVFNPANGSSLGIASGFPSGLGFNEPAAYIDRTFYAWQRLSGGSNRLVALRDVAPPELTVTSPVEGLSSRNPRPVYTWSASDGLGTGLQRFEVRVDNGPVVTFGADVTQYQAPADLADGPHVVTVTAFDAVGNPREVSRSFTTDTTPRRSLPSAEVDRT